MKEMPTGAKQKPLNHSPLFDIVIKRLAGIPNVRWSESKGTKTVYAIFYNFSFVDSFWR